jgi:hypothetical protein
MRWDNGSSQTGDIILANGASQNFSAIGFQQYTVFGQLTSGVAGTVTVHMLTV